MMMIMEARGTRVVVGIEIEMIMITITITIDEKMMMMMNRFLRRIFMIMIMIMRKVRPIGAGGKERTRQKACKAQHYYRFSR